MRKWGFLYLGLVIFCGVIFLIETYYPPLPISSASREDVLKKVSNSSEEIVKIADEEGYAWYISEMEGEKTYDHLKEMMEENGWYFKKQKDGSFFFQNNQGEMVVNSSTWTKQYIFFHFPEAVF